MRTNIYESQITIILWLYKSNLEDVIINGIIYLFFIYNIVYYFYTVVSEFTRYFYYILWLNTYIYLLIVNTMLNAKLEDYINIYSFMRYNY